MSWLKSFILIAFACSSIYAEIDEECIIKADSAVASLGDLITKIEPVKTNSMPESFHCKVSGMGDITLVHDKYVETVRNDAGDTSTFYVQFPQIDAVCEIAIPENVTKVPAYLVKHLGDSAKSECPTDDDAVEGAQNTNILPPLVLKDMLRLQACQSTASGVIGKKDLVTGFIRINWKNVRVSFNAILARNTTKVRINSVNVLSDDYDKIRVKCEKTSFRKSCQCVIATKFPVHMVVNAVSLILACNVAEETGKYDDIAQLFSCEE